MQLEVRGIGAKSPGANDGLGAIVLKNSAIVLI
jgi:hypothetical protein